MKKNVLLFVLLFLGIGLYAQKNSGKGFSYQAVARDANGEIMANKKIDVKFSLFPDGNTSETSWIETHTPTTDIFGVFSIIIGQGQRLDGSTATTFSDIDFGKAPANYFLQVEIKNGNDYLVYSKSRLLSVPYAEYAKNAISIPVGCIMPFATSDKVPEGWLLCDGRLFSQTEQNNKYKALYDVIGNAWGGPLSDPNKFYIPDLRELFLRGTSNGFSKDLDYNKKERDPDKDKRLSINEGGNTGDNVGSIQYYATKRPNTVFKTDNPGNHNHNFDPLFTRLMKEDGSHTLDQGWDDVDTPECQEPNLHESRAMIPEGSHTHIIDSGGDNDTRPANAYVNYIIKY